MAGMDRLPAALIAVAAVTAAGIAAHEGFRSRAYNDGTGVQTIGYGSTRHLDGRSVKPGDTVTPERALLMLAHDADRIWREASRCIADVPLYPHEAAAYQSLAYNIGASAFCRSTLARKLKQSPPDYAGACAEIRRWTRAGGREMLGLVRRREAEYRQCMGEAAP